MAVYVVPTHVGVVGDIVHDGVIGVGCSGFETFVLLHL